MLSHPEIAQFVGSLLETERLAPQRLAAYQRRLLARLLAHARQETRFYAERLTPLMGAGGAIDWDRWHDIPILRRAEAQDEFVALCARVQPEGAGGFSEGTSSGSTGRAVRHRNSHLQDLASIAASERFFSWHGIDPDRLTARIRSFDDRATSYPHGRCSTGWRVGQPESAVIDLSIATRVADQIEFLERARARYLISYPSNVREIAHTAARAAKSLRFDAVMTFGEMISPDMREAMEEYFGEPPIDRYGAAEVGQMAAMCPEARRYHVTSELVHLEIVDEMDGQPVPPGTLGRIVVTSLYNYAMPFIRYEIGDWGVLSPEPCPCGRTLPVLASIHGRTRNVFRFMDGSSVWPVMLSRDFQAHVPSRQFQFVQLTHDEIELRYVPATAGQTNDVEGLTSYVRRTLHPSLSVRLHEMTEIPRSAGGKFEDYISYVA